MKKSYSDPAPVFFVSSPAIVDTWNWYFAFFCKNSRWILHAIEFHGNFPTTYFGTRQMSRLYILLKSKYRSIVYNIVPIKKNNIPISFTTLYSHVFILFYFFLLMKPWYQWIHLRICVNLPHKHTHTQTHSYSSIHNACVTLYPWRVVMASDSRKLTHVGVAHSKNISHTKYIEEHERNST